MEAWILRQKQLLKLGKLDPSRPERLTKLGIHLSHHCKRKFKCEKREKKWQWQFEKLKDCHQIKGDCDMPRFWEEDHSLGAWVCTQWKQRAQTDEETEVTDASPDRAQKLEQLGIGWSVNDVGKRKERKKQRIVKLRFSNKMQCDCPASSR